MGQRTWWTRASIGAIGLGVLLATGCGTTADRETGTGESEEAGPVENLSVLVPNSPGSGYDVTARAWAKVLEDTGAASNVEVTNVEGAGGTVGLQRVVNEEGDADLLMQMGLGVVGSVYTNKAAATLSDTVPVARLIEEAEAIVVPGASPYQTLDDLVTAWKADPGGVTVGGASSPGGPDYLTPMLLAKAVGVDPTTVNYLAYDGGGELLAGLLGNKVAFGATGVGEVAEQAKTGDVRILAVTSEEPAEGVDAPTLKEEGIDLVFSNWRGVVAPPGIDDARAEQWVEIMTQMHESEEWQAALEENGWTDAFMTGDEFGSFMESENQRVGDVLKELGLA
jgi:putative tricarboxylic transport membrane protein